MAVLTGEFGLSVLGQWAPLYDSLLAEIFHVTGPDPVWPKLFQTLLAPLPIACAYALARAAASRESPPAAVGPRRAGRIAAWLVALDPSLVAFSGYLYTETLFTTLLLGAAWALFRRPGARSRGDLVAGGVLFGLAILTRSVVLYFGVVWPLWEVLRGRRRQATQALAVFGIALLLVLPWTVRNAFKYHALLLVDGTLGRTAYFAFSESLFNRDLGYVGPGRGLPARPECRVGIAPGAPPLPDAAELEALFPPGWHGLLGRRGPRLALYRTREFATRDLAAASRCELRHGLAFARAHPGVVATHVLRRFYAFWGPNSYLLRWVRQGFYGSGPLGRDAYPEVKALVVGWHVALVLCALLAFGRRSLPPFLAWAALLVAYYTGVHMLAVAHSRYRLPVMPFVMIAAASWLADPRPPEGRGRRAAVIAAGAGFLVMAAHYAIARLP